MWTNIAMQAIHNPESYHLKRKFNTLLHELSKPEAYNRSAWSIIWSWELKFVAADKKCWIGFKHKATKRET